MPNGINNWTYRDITKFIKIKGFKFWKEKKGSHEAWMNFSSNKVIELYYHGAKTPYSPKVMKLIAFQSGISQEDWGFSFERK